MYISAKIVRLKVIVYNTLIYKSVSSDELYRIMRTKPVSKLFLKKASELLAGLLSMFGFYTAMIVSVYNITFNQDSFGCSVACFNFSESRLLKNGLYLK